MSPCVRNDRETMVEDKKLLGQVRQVGSIEKKKRCLRNKAFAWAYLALDHPRFYCSTLRLAQPNALLKLVKRDYSLWVL